MFIIESDSVVHRDCLSGNIVAYQNQTDAEDMLKEIQNEMQTSYPNFPDTFRITKLVIR